MLPFVTSDNVKKIVKEINASGGGTPGGQGATIIDLGIIPITEEQTSARIDITEEQFNLAASNNNVIVVAKIVNDGETINIYAPKFLMFEATMEELELKEPIFKSACQGFVFDAVFYHYEGTYGCDMSFSREESPVEKVFYRHNVALTSSDYSNVFVAYLTVINAESSSYEGNIDALINDIGGVGFQASGYRMGAVTGGDDHVYHPVFRTYLSGESIVVNYLDGSLGQQNLIINSSDFSNVVVTDNVSEI